MSVNLPGAGVVTGPVVDFRANLPLTVTRRWARTALWFAPSARSRPGIFRSCWKTPTLWGSDISPTAVLRQIGSPFADPSGTPADEELTHAARPAVPPGSI